MKLIIGLGNPGDIYQDSRHNIGFSIIRSLCKDCKVSLKKESGINAVSAKIKLANDLCVLALPLTYMNLSGNAVKGLLKRHEIETNDLLVVCDDLDLELGRLKIKPSGSSGGHRGVESVIKSIDTQQFSRLRIGIGRPKAGAEVSEYVLKQFSRKEKATVHEAIEQAKECILIWIEKGATEAMNRFNKRSEENE
ncbi:MAG: aminoacyl-tRNA hydrolase [Candidatus Omnitrophica bacterium]|nr:aminoacyl-tRNA hydrolase [Candidatus Omnitrophota bacterium]